MNNRLKQFIAAENITQSQFADRIKVVRASVSHVLAGRNKPGYDFITAIMSAFPDLNIEWLMLGKGKMYKSVAEIIDSDRQTMRNGEDEQPQLFDYLDDSPAALDIVPQMQDSCTDTDPGVSEAHINSIKTSDNITQNTTTQRKANKIIVFYDDNTFQEFTAL